MPPHHREPRARTPPKTNLLVVLAYGRLFVWEPSCRGRAKPGAAPHAAAPVIQRRPVAMRYPGGRRSPEFPAFGPGPVL